MSRYSALAGSTTSHGMPRSVADSRRHRTVCDLPAPVAPQTNTCRLSESAEIAERPAGSGSCRAPRQAGSPLPSTGVSGVTSKSGLSAKRTPGTSALRRPDERGEQLGGAVEGRGGDAVAPPAGSPRLARAGAGLSAYGSPLGRWPRRTARRPARRWPHRRRPPRRDPPEPAGLPAQQLIVPLLEAPRLDGPLRKPVRLPFGDALPHPDVFRQRAAAPGRDRLGDDEPPEGPAPAAQQPVIKGKPARLGRAWAALLVRHEQPVADAGDFPPPRAPRRAGQVPGGSTVPRAPAGSESITSVDSLSALANERVPAAMTRTGPPGAARTHPNATGQRHPRRFPAIPAW